MVEMIGALKGAGIDGSTLVLAVFALRMDAKVAGLTAVISCLAERISNLEGGRNAG